LLIPTKEHLQIVGVIWEYAQACRPQKATTEHLIAQTVEPNIAKSCRLRRPCELKVTGVWAKHEIGLMFIHADINPGCSEWGYGGLQGRAGGGCGRLGIFHPNDMKSNAQHFQSREN
jgi:hypothetical protein